MNCDIDRKLLAAVRGGYELRVRRLLAKGANPNCQNEDGTPVVLLVSNDNCWVRDRIVDLLIVAGADEAPLLAAARVSDFCSWPATRYIRYHTGTGREVVDHSLGLARARDVLAKAKR